MIREKIDASKERQIILYSIISTKFLAEIRSKARIDLFKSPYAKTVWGWISAYFDEFSEAPNKDIQSIYTAHKIEVQEDEEEEAIATFLQSLSDSDTEINNIDYAVSQAIEWLNIRAQENLIESLRDAIARKDIESGNEAIAEYASIEKHQTKGVSLLDDIETSAEAFKDEDDVLFSFPGTIGLTIGEFKRTDFISFLGYAKRGKSHMLWETAKEAMFASNKVLFLSLEMPQKQILKRIWRSLSKKPKRTKTVRIPYFVEDAISTPEDRKYIIEYEEKEMEGFIPDIAWFQNWVKRFKLYFHGGDLRVVSMPSRSATVKDIEIYLNNLEYYEKWIPDVVVIDYADLISSKLKGEYRHQLDDIWANLRRLALERNICIVTASQSGRAAAKADSTDETIAEDIRKIAHVTKMIAINATAEEKANGILRIAQLAERDDEQHFEQSLVLSCLDLGQVCIDSRFRSEVMRDV